MERTSAAKGIASEDLLDLLPDAVIGFDADRRIRLLNRAAEAAYGFSVAEALGSADALLGTRFPIPLAEILSENADTGRWREPRRPRQGRAPTSSP